MKKAYMAQLWPLTEEKIQATHKLVQKQLEKKHIKENNSP